MFPTEEEMKELVKKLFLFDFNKYFKRRDLYFHTKSKAIKVFLLLWLKRQHERMNADIAVDINLKKNQFLGTPIFNPHGINGIVISQNDVIGKNCFISHQVTIGTSMGKAPVIGDNVYIGPGAKIFGGIKIGNNVRIDANCPVFFDVPDNSTVVLPKPRVIVKEKDYEYYTIEEDSVKRYSVKRYGFTQNSIIE